MRKKRILIPLVTVSLVLMLALPSAVSAAPPDYQTFNEGKNSGGTTAVVTKPAGTTSGDLLIGVLSTDGKDETHSSPEGDTWSDIYVNQTDASSFTFSVWSKTAGGSEPATYTFGVGSGEAMYAMVIRIDGQDVSSPIHKQAILSLTGSTVNHPNVTTTIDDCLILRLFGADDGDITEDSGWAAANNISVDESSTGANQCSGGAAWEDLVSQGDSGVEACSLTATEAFISVTLAIAPTSGVALPTVISSAATDVTTFSATLNGEITALGGENCDERGFVWGDDSLGDPGDVTPGSTSYDSYYTDSGSHGTGTFSYVATDFNPQTTYYFRAYAHNSAGYEYSDTEQSFLTLPRLGSGIGPTGTVF